MKTGASLGVCKWIKKPSPAVQTTGSWGSALFLVATNFLSKTDGPGKKALYSAI